MFGMNRDEKAVVSQIDSYLGQVIDGKEALNANDERSFASFRERVTTLVRSYGEPSMQHTVTLKLDRIYVQKFVPKTRPAVSAPVFQAPAPRLEEAPIRSVAVPRSLEKLEQDLTVARGTFLESVGPVVSADDLTRSGTVEGLTAQINQVDTEITALKTLIDTSENRIATAEKRSSTQQKLFEKQLENLEGILTNLPTNLAARNLNVEVQALQKELDQSYDRIITKNNGGKFDRTELAAELKNMRRIKNLLVRKHVELNCAEQLLTLRPQVLALKTKIEELKALSANPNTSIETLAEKRAELSTASAELRTALNKTNLNLPQERLAALNENSIRLVGDIDHYVQEKGREGFFESDEVAGVRTDIHQLIVGVSESPKKESQIEAIVGEMLVENRFLTNNLSHYLTSIISEERNLNAANCNDAVSKKTNLQAVSQFGFDAVSQTMHRAAKRKVAATEKKKDEERALELKEVELARLTQSLEAARASLKNVQDFNTSIRNKMGLDGSNQPISAEFQEYVKAFLQLPGHAALNEDQIASAIFNDLKTAIPSMDSLNAYLKADAIYRINQMVVSLRTA
jgi:hypothetical protein